jgi:hypothetical protein
MDYHFQDKSLGRLPLDAKLLRDHTVPFDHDAVAHPLQYRVGRARKRQDVILLVEFIPRMHDTIRNITVVGQ